MKIMSYNSKPCSSIQHSVSCYAEQEFFYVKHVIKSASTNLIMQSKLQKYVNYDLAVKAFNAIFTQLERQEATKVMRPRP